MEAELCGVGNRRAKDFLEAGTSAACSLDFWDGGEGKEPIFEAGQLLVPTRLFVITMELSSRRHEYLNQKLEKAKTAMDRKILEKQIKEAEREIDTTK